jgi:dUTP pyrophosphatase
MGLLRTRGFEIVRKRMRDSKVDGILPKRSTEHSACYDIFVGENLIIPSYKTTITKTNIKAYMQEDEVLLVFIRSSVGIKKGISLANGTGVIDSDFFGNPDNDGNIGVALRNNTDTDIMIQAGERIAQAMFTKFLKADDDDATGTREGGIGSTGT